MLSEEGSHFVLVHGACHGAWCWFKVVDLLRRAGHRATALDLAASGLHPADADSISSFHAYNQPLSDFLSALSLSERRKVILVGASLGGISITHACEEFPGQLAALVYVAAAVIPSGLSFKEHCARILACYSLEYFYKNGSAEDPTSFIFTSDSLQDSLYNASPSEDIILASMLLRPSPAAAQVAPKLELTHEGFESVPKVYIKANLDSAFEVSAQGVAIEVNIKDIRAIDSDHSPFFSAVKELVACLLDVHDKYGIGCSKECALL